MTDWTAAEDRAIGALVGLAVGDAVGTTLEFQPPGTFEPITDMVGGGPFGLEPGQWTDDTSMALCLAESLVDRGGMDLVDQLRRYVAWWREGYLSSTGRCFDIGGTTRKQLARFERTGVPVDPHTDRRACGNGSLMRLAPVSIRWWWSPDEVVARAAESSMTTHAAGDPVAACAALALMTAALIVGEDPDDAFSMRMIGQPRFDDDDEHWTIESFKTDKEPPEIKGTGYCIESLEAAVWAASGAADFRDAILRAANLGDDADTTAAIAGQLAGARWGASGIPAEWRAKVHLRERLVELARSLYRAGDPLPDHRKWVHDDFLHAWWVDDDVLAGEHPAARHDPERTRRKVDLLVDAGVRTFVDLTTRADGLDGYEIALRDVAWDRDLSLRHVEHPIPDLDVLDDAGYDAILATIDEARVRGAVYVHCWGGVGRTGTVMGCLLAQRGLGFDEIRAELDRLRAGTHKAHRPAPETEAQIEVIRRRAR